MDPDLDSLLDDALSDFDKHAPTHNSKEKQKATGAIKNDGSQSSTSKPATNPTMPPTDIFKEFFDDETTKQLQEEWHNAIHELGEENPELLDEMKKLSQTTTNFPTCAPEQTAAGNSQKVDLAESMQAALESLSLNAEGKGDDLPDMDDDFMKSFLNMGADGETGNPMNMMENIMNSMLSKEMLYPPMKEMCKHYPQWLKDNEGKLSASDKANYENQLKCLKKVCDEFESEKDSDTEVVKKERFLRVMDLIHEMQGYGQPPEQLMENGAPIPSPDACLIS